MQPRLHSNTASKHIENISVYITDLLKTHLSETVSGKGLFRWVRVLFMAPSRGSHQFKREEQLDCMNYLPLGSGDTLLSLLRFPLPSSPPMPSKRPDYSEQLPSLPPQHRSHILCAAILPTANLPHKFPAVKLSSHRRAQPCGTGHVCTFSRSRFTLSS